MRRTSVRLFNHSFRYHASFSHPSDKPPLISIADATFYRHHPSSVLKTASGEQQPNPPLFPNLDFLLPSFSDPSQHWSILSASSSARTTLLQILRGQHLAFPPTARTYPYLSTPGIAAKDLRLRSPNYAIQYVGFDAERGGLGGGATRGAYLSARYESRREETDFSLQDYLRGNTELNASEDESLIRHPDVELLQQVIGYLKLENLIDMPVSNLSNGQTRRARIARALLSRPECLLLDGPFMGLDPPTVKHLSSLLYELAKESKPRLMLSLKPDDAIPDWITHLVFVDEHYNVNSQGSKEEVFRRIAEQYLEVRQTSKSQLRADAENAFNPARFAIREVGRHLDAKGYLPEVQNMYLQKNFKGMLPTEEASLSVDGFSANDPGQSTLGEPVVEMDGVQIRYGDKCVLGDWQSQVIPGSDQEQTQKPGLHWTVRSGQRWGVFGANGSGKTTLLAILTSDHPQSYSQPLKLFGRTRLPKKGTPGLTLWDIQSRLGHSSPEVHAFFPKSLSVRRAIESAWADTPISPPKFSVEVDQKVDSVLRWFQAELMPGLGPTELQKEESRRWQADRDPFRATKWAAGRSHLQRIRTEYEDQEINVGRGLEWADETKFGEVGFSAQRVLLFLRAVIRNPPLVILDEAFSGMDESARDKCLLFLSHGQTVTQRLLSPTAEIVGPGLAAAPAAGGLTLAESDISKLGRVRVKGLQPDQALLVVSHNPAEVPGCVREWICLPEAGQGSARFGRLDGPLSMKPERWSEVWGT